MNRRPQGSGPASDLTHVGLGRRYDEGVAVRVDADDVEANVTTNTN
jgi:hypothetical protein